MKKQPTKKAVTQKPRTVRSAVESKKTVAIVTDLQSPPTRSAPSTEQIRARAYQVFQESGCVPGHDMEHWLQAERELSNGAC